MFINTTETIGIVLGNATTFTTGSMFLSLFMIMIILIVLAILFRIPLEYIALILLPLNISYMAYYSEFLATSMIIFIYFAFMLATRWLFK